MITYYIIASFVAAAVIAAAAMPSRRGAARTFLFGGTLRTDAAPSEPGIVALVNDRGELEIHRFGLEYMSEDGAYSLAVTIIGFDVTIEERLTPGRLPLNNVTAAYAAMDCFGAERYHFQYRSEVLGRTTSFSLNIRPGNRLERRLE